ncbi:hypothetical protein BDQ94DRAFT_157808 [Aspergillus welwitschiae]|uniref:Uncharacterized protein n=1 Tax=Aspergillus welwitschiae TaxID=1341132 RepID=A0A3F3QAV0_9EURO|nr:hypothetical protein BDQ94DRAFT_157808 [Aspergillus welwitschiae]RDH36318.1 hypothetical protein BDQ94DRAFT_157808 [Aspergillus welwitschiae]
MCVILDIAFSCGCKKEMDFVQCKQRQGTNVRCCPAKKGLGKTSPNYCRRHLVPPGAPKTCVKSKEPRIIDEIMATD